jgi:hypothetical protein
MGYITQKILKFHVGIAKKCVLQITKYFLIRSANYFNFKANIILKFWNI